VFPLANTIGWVFGARFIDRIGKGIRGAPRDAMVADIAPCKLRGAAYGLRQALDSVGAFLGPLFALTFMAWFANDIRTVLWVALIPAFIAVAILVFAVREPEKTEINSGRRSSVTFVGIKRLPFRYWLIVFLSAVFTLARFSEAFLVLRAQSVGLAIGYVPAMLIIMNLVYASTAYPLGVVADRTNPKTMLIMGIAVLVIADIVLAAAQSLLPTFLGAAFWGLHMGLTQGLFAKLVADTAPAALRGTAFGIFNLVGGVALLIASAIAGSLWNAFGASATFLAGAAFAALALFGLILYRRKHQTIQKESA
jgi:MFS family permease